MTLLRIGVAKNGWCVAFTHARLLWIFSFLHPHYAAVGWRHLPGERGRQVEWMQTNRDLCTFQNKRGKKTCDRATREPFPPERLTACSPAGHTVASPSPTRRRLPSVLCHPKEEFGGQWLQFRALNYESGFFPFISQLLVHRARAHALCMQWGLPWFSVRLLEGRLRLAVPLAHRVAPAQGLQTGQTWPVSQLQKWSWFDNLNHGHNHGLKNKL